MAGDFFVGVLGTVTLKADALTPVINALDSLASKTPRVERLIRPPWSSITKVQSSWMPVMAKAHS